MSLDILAFHVLLLIKLLFTKFYIIYNCKHILYIIYNFIYTIYFWCLFLIFHVWTSLLDRHQKLPMSLQKENDMSGHVQCRCPCL